MTTPTIDTLEFRELLEKYKRAPYSAFFDDTRYLIAYIEAWHQKEVRKVKQTLLDNLNAIVSPKKDKP